MARESLNLTDKLHQYLLDVSLRETDVMKRLRDETAKLPMAVMQIAPEQGQFMALLVRVAGVHRALEVGTFTGYSALCIAQALPANGQLVACDVSHEWTDIAQRYWHEAGVAHKIRLRLGPALDTLDELLSADQSGSFDLVFLDADKDNYPHYYERALRLLRPGGLLLIDNVLWGGRVLDPHDKDPRTAVIRDLNRNILHDPRVDISLLPVGDGLTLARKL